MECCLGAGLGGLRPSTEPLNSWMWRKRAVSFRQEEGLLVPVSAAALVLLAVAGENATVWDHAGELPDLEQEFEQEEGRGNISCEQSSVQMQPLYAFLFSCEIGG